MGSFTVGCALVVTQRTRAAKEPDAEILQVWDLGGRVLPTEPDQGQGRSNPRPNGVGTGHDRFEQADWVSLWEQFAENL